MKTTKHYRKYQRLYGPHFTKDLCDFAVSMMEDSKGPITPITKQQLEEKLKVQNITLQYNKMYDAVYVANMCKADYLGRSVKDEGGLVQFIIDTIEDPDGYEGMVFTRFYADCVGSGTPINWEDMI